MQTTSETPDVQESMIPHARVRADLRAGGVLLAVVIGGNLLWHASDAGIVAAFAGR